MEALARSFLRNGARSVCAFGAAAAAVRGAAKKIGRGSSPWVVASGPALRAAEGGAVPENEPFLLNSGRGLPFGIFQRAAFWQPGAPEIKFFPAKFQR